MTAGRRKGILLGIAALLCLMAVYVKVTLEQNKGEQEEGTILHITEEPVTEITWQRSEGDGASLAKKDGQWIWIDDSSFPVNQQMAQMMADTAAGPEVIRKLELTEENKIKYGLKQPVCIVDVKAEGKTCRLLFGAKNSTTGDYYMMAEGQDGIYTVAQRIFNLYDHTILELAEMETLPGIPLGQVEQFSAVSGANRFVLKQDAEKKAWIVSDADMEGQTADSWLAQTYVSDFLGIQFTEMAAYEPDQDELDSWGLLESQERLVFVYREEDGGRLQNYQLIVGNRDASGDSRYCMVSGGQAVYLADGAALEFLLTRKAADYVDLDLIDREPDETEGLDIWLGGRHVRLAAGEEAFRTVFYALYGMKGEKCLTGEEKGEEREQGERLLKVTVTMAADDLDITFYAWDQNYCLADSGGRLLLVNRQRFKELSMLLEQTVLLS